MNQIPSDCLRPAFTEKIARLLADGRAVNVYGHEGNGLGRLVDDLKRCCPDTVRFVRLSMRSYADSYDGFLMALYDALRIQNAEGLDLRSALNGFLAIPGNRLWLCLEHFDRLADEQVGDKAVDAQGYDLHFLNYLNSLNNNPNAALLLTSDKEITTRELYVGGKRVRGSRLDVAQRHPLEPLTFAEIEAQLQRSMPPSAAVAMFFQNKPAFFTPLVSEIAAHLAPLFFLEHIAAKIPTEPDTSLDRFQELLRFWKKDYAAQHAKSTALLFNDVERTAHRWKSNANRALDIVNMLRAIKTKAGLTLATLGSILFSLYLWGERIWGWLSHMFTK